MAEHGVEGYNNSGVSTQLVGDYVEVPHKHPWRYEEDGLTVTRGAHGRARAATMAVVSCCTRTRTASSSSARATPRTPTIADACACVAWTCPR